MLITMLVCTLLTQGKIMLACLNVLGRKPIFNFIIISVTIIHSFIILEKYNGKQRNCLYTGGRLLPYSRSNHCGQGNCGKSGYLEVWRKEEGTQGMCPSKHCIAKRNC